MTKKEWDEGIVIDFRNVVALRTYPDGKFRGLQGMIDADFFRIIKEDRKHQKKEILKQVLKRLKEKND